MGQHRTSIWEEWYLILPWFPVGLAIINLWGEVFMDNGDLITAIIAAAGVILAALIAGVVALIGQSRQLKRDGKSIDETKAIASDIQPKINNIDHRTEKQSEKLDIIIADVEYRKRLEANFPNGVSGRDLIQAGIQKLLSEGSELNLQYQELSLKYQQAQNRIMELNAENSQLKGQLSLLKSKLQKLDQDYEWEP